MSLVKQLAGQTIVYGLGQILPRIIQFVLFSTYLTYKLKDTGDYAVYLDLYAYATVLIVFFSYRMDTALFRFGRKKEDLDEAYGAAFWPMIMSSVGIILIGWISAESLASWLAYPNKGYYIIWFSWIIAFDVLILLPMARLRLIDQPRLFVAYKIGNVVLTIFLVLFFLELAPVMFPAILSRYLGFCESPVDFVFISNLLASAAVCIVLIWRYHPKYVAINWSLWRKMAGYAWPLVVVGIAGGINQFFGVPLQKFLLGEAIDVNKDQAGIYGAVQKIPALLALFTTAYNYAAEPFFFKNDRGQQTRKLYGDIALFFIIIAGGIALVIYLGIDLFGYIIGPSYRSGLYLVPILLMAYLFLGIYYNVSIWYKLCDKTKYGAMIALIGAGITILGSIVLLPLINIDASAWVALACYVTMVVLAYLLGQRHYPIDYPLWPMGRQIALIVLIMSLGYAIRGESLWINLCWGALLFILYVGLSYTWEGKRLQTYL